MEYKPLAPGPSNDEKTEGKESGDEEVSSHYFVFLITLGNTHCICFCPSRSVSSRMSTGKSFFFSSLSGLHSLVFRFGRWIASSHLKLLPAYSRLLFLNEISITIISDSLSIPYMQNYTSTCSTLYWVLNLLQVSRLVLVIFIFHPYMDG